MSTILDGKGRSKEELQAMEVAEEAREKEWTQPSFVAELFMGKLNLNAITPFPEQDPEDKRAGDEFVAKLDRFFKEKVDTHKIDEEELIPDHVMKGLAELGAFGIKIPKKYGGLGLSQVNYLRALATVNSYCASTTAMLSAHQSIGVPQPLMLFGTEEQKTKYLPMLAKGAVSAFGLTEPGVGSDPAKMITVATPTPDGNHYIINGTKLWCTNGAIADLLIVMAKTPSTFVNGREKQQITAFIVDSKTPGFEVVHRCKFMGLRGIQNALLKFKDVKVPKENIVWGTGKGLRLALITLNAGRLSLPAGCIGTTKRCLDIVRTWGNERVQWGGPVGKHEAGADKLATISATLFAMESITYLAGAWVDKKSQDIRLEAAMAKLFCSIQSDRLVDETVQMRGGRGYERGPSLKARGEHEFPVERMYRDSRINQIVEGTNEILRLFIAREALDKHLSIAGDVLNPKASIGKKLSTLVTAGLFYAFWLPAQFLHFSYWPRFLGFGALACQMRFVARNSHKLARTTFILMLLNGPKLEKKQLQLMRLVDIATDLFAMATTIARAHKLKDRTQEYKHAAEVAAMFCAEASHRIRANFRDIWCNSDKRRRKLGAKIMDGELKWQEKSL